MEFDDAVRSRRMVRSFRDDPVPPELIDELIDLARRSPSAGNTQAQHHVVLEGEDTDRYWRTSLTAERRADFAWPGLLRAPVLILPYVDVGAYVSRYSESDKAHSGLGESSTSWPVPYWFVDGGMAAMTILHAAVTRGLGALFFGQFEHEPALAREFGVPEGVRAIGTIAVGWPDDGDRVSRSARRGRVDLTTVLHRGGW